jgi:hypothetical protein
MVLGGCVLAGPEERVPAETREPVGWILIERPYGDLRGAPGAMDGRVNPNAVCLAFQPIFAEDMAWNAEVDPQEHLIEVVSIEPSRPAAPGEIVTATVRVGRALENRRYRLRARPAQEDVRIVEDPEAIVRGRAPAVFRFTSLSSGRGGIVVDAERVE